MRTWRNRKQRADDGTAARPVRPGGFTLIELLVVIAILALMASVAVPTFARMGFFSRNEMQSTARELYALLRAAKIYAATYRVDTAVVYLDPDVSDQTAPACLRAAAMIYEYPASPVFVPVQDTEGVFDAFEGFAGVILDRDPRLGDGQPDEERDRRERRDKTGLSEVDVYFPRSDPDFPTVEGCHDPEDKATMMAERAEPLQAHVFTPLGRMRNTFQERFEVYIGLKKGEDEEERWVAPEDHSLGERYKTIELHRATGRVRIAADEG